MCKYIFGENVTWYISAEKSRQGGLGGAIWLILSYAGCGGASRHRHTQRNSISKDNKDNDKSKFLKKRLEIYQIPRKNIFAGGSWNWLRSIAAIIFCFDYGSKDSRTYSIRLTDCAIEQYTVISQRCFVSTYSLEA